MLGGAEAHMVKLIGSGTSRPIGPGSPHRAGMYFRVTLSAEALAHRSGYDQLLRCLRSWDLRPGAFSGEASVGVAADEGNAIA